MEALPPQAADGRITEDCLVLDVLVSKKIFDGRRDGSKGAPVLVYIHVSLWNAVPLSQILLKLMYMVGRRLRDWRKRHVRKP